MILKKSNTSRIFPDSLVSTAKQLSDHLISKANLDHLASSNYHNIRLVPSPQIKNDIKSLQYLTLLKPGWGLPLPHQSRLHKKPKANQKLTYKLCRHISAKKKT